MNEKSLIGEKLLTLSQVTQALNIAKHRVAYLFDSRKLKVEEFIKLPNGERVYRKSDIEKIKKALFEVATK